MQIESEKKKPSTSNQSKTPQQTDGLTGSFPPIKDGPNSVQQLGAEDLNTFEELQQRIRELEEINDKLLHERINLDKELGM